MLKKDSKALTNVSIATLYLIYLFDIASIVIVLVLFSSLIIDPSSQMLAAETSLNKRNLILGLLYAAYPITQFLGAPILGELSDRVGRKIIINISTLGTTATFCLSALSILNNNLPLLFLSRLVGGFFAGNASLAQAAVSNLVHKENRSRAMALFSVVGGFSWIVGPFIGSVFSNSNLVSWFGLDTPFWFMGLAFLLCWGLFMLSYTCLHVKTDQKHTTSLLQSIKNLATIFHHRMIVIPFIVSLFTMFNWMIVQDFLSPFLFEKFNFSHQQIGMTFAYLSLWWLIGGLFAMFIFQSKRPSKFLALTHLIPAVLIFIYTLDKSYSFIYWAVAFANMLFAIAYSGYSAMFSHLVPEHMQGKLYGSWTGGFALINALAPAFAGWISFLGIDVPFQIASLGMLISGIAIYLWVYRNNHKLEEIKA